MSLVRVVVFQIALSCTIGAASSEHASVSITPSGDSVIRRELEQERTVHAHSAELLEGDEAKAKCISKEVGQASYCPSGELITDAANMECAGTECGDDDTDACCKDKASCSSKEEDKGTWCTSKELVADAAGTQCAGATCQDSDKASCCKAKLEEDKTKLEEAKTKLEVPKTKLGEPKTKVDKVVEKKLEEPKTKLQKSDKAEAATEARPFEVVGKPSGRAASTALGKAQEAALKIVKQAISATTASPRTPTTTTAQSVNCGGHKATACHLCLQDNGPNWCHGDCEYKDGKCRETESFKARQQIKKEASAKGVTEDGERPKMTGKEKKVIENAADLAVAEAQYEAQDRVTDEKAREAYNKDPVHKAEDAGAKTASSVLMVAAVVAVLGVLKFICFPSKNRH